MTPRHYHPEAAARTRPPMNDLPDIACRGQDPELFFPGDHGDATPAQRICRRCPHLVMCLDWALDTDQRFGVWGGATPALRGRILAKRAKETR